MRRSKRPLESLLLASAFLGGCGPASQAPPPPLQSPVHGTFIGPDGEEYPTIRIRGGEYLLFEQGAELP